MYDFFDACYCISLRESIDRQKHILDLKQRLSIPIEFYIVERKQNPIEGSRTSHIELIKFAYDNNMENILIFEDDVMESNTYSLNVLQECISFMKYNNDWDLFYLGWCPSTPNKSVFYSCLGSSTKENNWQYVYKGGCYCLHAYVVSRKGMKQILSYFYKFDGKDLDVILLSKDLKTYVCVPMLFDQKWCIQNTKVISNFDACKLSQFINIADTSSFLIVYAKYIIILSFFIIGIICFYMHLGTRKS
jgi:hypothetical protein